MLRAVGFFDRLRGSRWSLAGVARPWGNVTSILEHLRQHTTPAGKLDDEGLTLPDESALEGHHLRWAAGALDGVFGHHLNRSTDNDRVAELATALVALLGRASAEGLSELYRLATRDALLGIVDRLTDRLREANDIRPERVHELGNVLAREAPHREAVKLGLALIGSIEADDTELILAIGVHDEFTLFAAVALVNQNREQAERALFGLAKRVDGWGRIQVVERMAETREPDIQGWLLREGFRNSVMDAYLAYTCAMAGELHVALAKPEIDEALLRGASGILSALAAGGPAQDLADYAHAEVAVAAFVDRLQGRDLDLELVTTLDLLHPRAELSDALRARIGERCDSPRVKELIAEGLDSDDAWQFNRANAAAAKRGIDTFDEHERRVRAGRSTSFGALFQAATPDTVDRALDAVAPHVPLTSIASGPALEAGVGPEFAEHKRLESIVQHLPRFPGKGVAFIGAALQSPVVRCRNMAVRTLAAWTKAQWPTSLAVALDRAIAQEPNEELRQTMLRVRAGGDFDEPEEDDELEEDDEPLDSGSSPLLH
jgi:hypothetical protein